MKKIATSLIALAIGVTVASSAFAVTLMTETFTYPNGDLTVVGAPFWLVHSGTPPTDIQVVSGQAVGLMSNFPDDNRAFGPRAANDVTYACFQVTIPATTTPVTNYFAHFKDSGTGFTSRVYVTASGASFTFGLGTSSTMTQTWPVALNYGQQYTIAISYNAVTGVSEMWVDPIDATSPKVTTVPGTTGLVLAGFALRQSNSGGTAWGYMVDNIQVGTTFDDTCPHPTPVNSSSWGHIKTMYR